MSQYMDVHSGFFGVTAEQLKEAHDRDLAIEADEGVHFERAWLDPAAGKVFCLASGPSKEAVLRIHERAGHPTPEIYELTVEVQRPAAAEIGASDREPHPPGARPSRPPYAPASSETSTAAASASGVSGRPVASVDPAIAMAKPTSIVGVSVSSRMSTPRTAATTGFT